MARSSPWRSINSPKLCFSERPTPLPAGVIETLQRQEDAHGLIEYAESSLKPGDSVVVLSGPFAHQLGRCSNVSDDERVAILLDLLGRKVRVVLDADVVAAA